MRKRAQCPFFISVFFAYPHIAAGIRIYNQAWMKKSSGAQFETIQSVSAFSITVSDGMLTMSYNEQYVYVYGAID